MYMYILRVMLLFTLMFAFKVWSLHTIWPCLLCLHITIFVVIILVIFNQNQKTHLEKMCTYLNLILLYLLCNKCVYPFHPGSGCITLQHNIKSCGTNESFTCRLKDMNELQAFGYSRTTVTIQTVNGKHLRHLKETT